MGQNKQYQLPSRAQFEGGILLHCEIVSLFLLKYMSYLILLPLSPSFQSTIPQIPLPLSRDGGFRQVKRRLHPPYSLSLLTTPGGRVLHLPLSNNGGFRHVRRGLHPPYSLFSNQSISSLSLREGCCLKGSGRFPPPRE